MPAQSSFLVQFFQHHLPFTPTPSQVARFEADLAVVSPHIMLDALKEVAAGKALRNRPLDEWRQAIFGVYHRKVAEQGQLHPVFHTFETAFRSFVAVRLEDHYAVQDWWMPFYSAMKQNTDPRSVAQVNKRHVSKDLARVIGRIIAAIDGEDLRRLQIPSLANGYEFMEKCDLAHVEHLIVGHWLLFTPKLARGKLKLTQNDFRAKFKRVREARNDIYHHKTAVNLTNVVETAEDLLDYVDVSLQFTFARVRAAKAAAPTFAMPIQGRHGCW